MTPAAANAVTPDAENDSTLPSYGSGGSTRTAARHDGHDDEDDPEADEHRRPPEVEVECGDELTHEEDAAKADEDESADQAGSCSIGRGASASCAARRRRSDRDRRAVGSTPTPGRHRLGRTGFGRRSDDLHADRPFGD